MGTRGHVYRIDGTQFAIISNTLTLKELKESYGRLRTYLHEDFRVDGRKILLDLHCGALQAKDFEVDSQTVYACLNFADDESKMRHQGDMVEFQNDPNDGTQQRLEKLHAIRASIMHGCRGFYLLYQPVVDARTEQLMGAEALLRWKDDHYGMVPPDDFGTGFSSVGILKEIPFNIIKIDRSFVRTIEESDVDRQLVRNIVDLASIFSAKLCIEGIETEGMRDILKSYNVESFQGYYYAKPLPFREFLDTALS